jgi:hypothetical protein
MIQNYQIGSDIELFLKNLDTDEIISAEGIAKGTKNNPYVFDKSSKYFATSLDNVLFEFCIPPANRVHDFVANVKKSMDYVGSQLPPRICYVPMASATLHDRFLRTANARTFGCSVDFNAWSESANMPPEAYGNLRSAGFHIHVGFDNPNNREVLALMKSLDLYVGIASVIIDPDTERRQLYGKAGSYRPKPYGAEYRVLSSFFASDEKLIAWVYESTERAIEFVNSGQELKRGDIAYAINNSEKTLAESLIKEYNIILP